MAAVRARNKPTAATGREHELEQRIDALEAELAASKAENAAVARAIVGLAIRLPGKPATASQILSGQLQLGHAAAEAIIAAAARAT